MMIVKTLMYTGICVSELINIQLTDIDFHYCQVRINNGKGDKDRIVPFPQSFKELLAMHADAMKKKQRSIYLNHRGRRSTRTGEYDRF
nr:tyrosine-type recombinase/integrase [Brevibacillus halotolerans]